MKLLILLRKQTFALHSDLLQQVQYQTEERLMDIKEHLQGLEAKVNSLEHQQAQQQYINIDGFENSDARVIFMKVR